MGKRRKPSNLASSPEALIFSGDENEEDYKTFSKMGFVCMEEISGEEAKKYLNEIGSKPKPDILEPSKKKTKKTKKKLETSILTNSTQIGKILEKVELEPEDLPSWRKYPLDSRLLLGLKRLGFITPTPVQEQCLDAFFSAEHGKDILGSAPTVTHQRSTILTLIEFRVLGKLWLSVFQFLITSFKMIMKIIKDQQL